MKLLSVALAFLTTFGLAISSVVLAGHSALEEDFQVLTIQEDQFRNWDFNTEWEDRTNVDWPVTMLFWNNANVQSVKSLFYSGSGSTKYGRLDDGQGWFWNGDTGTKQSPSCLGDAYHLRLYANSHGTQTEQDDYNYNVDWGFYVLGATHIDKKELCDPKSGWSEQSEEHFANSSGLPMNHDWANFYNEDMRGFIGCCHYLDNNGYATAVKVS